MNEWVRRSIEIANAPGYLDNLLEVYPVTQETERYIPTEIKEELRDLFYGDNDYALIKRLLKLPKFPIKDPYVAFLRKREIFLEYNPRTVHRIAERIRSMGYENMIKALEEPKEFNRQIGTLFKKWLRTLEYPFLNDDVFVSLDGVSFLDGSENHLLNFANSYLRCNLIKGPDFIAKVGDVYIIGEAKFLTDYGGHQNAQFEDALRLLRGSDGNALRVAVLDGVVWIKDHTKMYRTICQLEKPAFTALLLREFLESLR